jgi:hypothetical protein
MCKTLLVRWGSLGGMDDVIARYSGKMENHRMEGPTTSR